MSLDRRARRPVPALAATLVALGVAVAGVARAQPLASPQLAAEAARIFQELAQLRGLPAVGPPPRVVVRSREERRRFITREFARKYPPVRLEAERRALVAWGLVPPEF
ncbi:MAG: hypothetical protein HYV62_14985, partial [Candidatus Rokubacteria bacterium]|nr:hypothetical protein [Candidatus Rokubacteria bacterium]